MVDRHNLQTIGLAALDDVRRDGDAAAYSLRITSGTTSGEPVLIARRRVMPGDEPFDFYPGCVRIAVFAGTLSVRLRFLCDLIVDYAPEDRRMLVVGSEHLPVFDALLGAFRPDCLYGTPSFIASAAEHVRSVDVRAGIRAVHMNGDAFPEVLEARFREIFPNAAFTSLYAAAETGLVSTYPCSYLPRDTHHPRRDVRVDVADADGDGVGELVVSAPWSPSFRLERYRTGDLGRIIPGPCPCGATETFQLLGRKGAEVVKFMGATFHRSVFDRTARTLGTYILDYRATFRESYGREQPHGELVLEVVPTPLLAARSDSERFIAAMFSARLYVTPSRTLAAVLGSGMPLTVRATLVPPFPPEVKIVRLKRDARSTALPHERSE